MATDSLERVTNLLALLLEARTPLTLDQIAHDLVDQYPATDGARTMRPVPLDQGGGRRVVQPGVGLRPGQLRADARRQRLAELDAPLVEAVDAPDRALHEHDVLVERDQLAEHLRRCLLYTSPSPRDGLLSRMPSSA